ncbi:hypothetical protein CDL12_11239 [Handroanthus impetiginosus]|uniref:RING-type domain-containing protein n=1 Tax=Handroanthus impetiginosus TaxID=429701 RepID=A0A2G9HF14_9LAMI|nr:hypothetical protein CDL12_11239 [Handroanthus impetiginosus]
MSTSLTPPPLIDGATATQLSPPHVTSSPYFSSASASSSSIIIVIIVIASAFIVSASIYLLLRFLSHRFHRSFSSASDVVVRHNDRNSNQLQCHVAFDDLLDSLPLFSFRSVTGNLAGGDCAVCLSKFEPYDQLRLLPLCCHAFHVVCIDTWIVSNQTCPLCRSTVLPCGSDVLDKILSADNRRTGNDSLSNRNANGGSFRIEIGSISRRHGGAVEAMERTRRSYSVGSFEYIVNDNGCEVPVDCITHRRGVSNRTSNEKESSVGVPVPEPPGDALAAEVAGGRSWLRDRLASISISSRAMSFRSAGGFFSGSSLRSEAVVVPEDLEANRFGEEISELFRWLSGI